MIFITDLQNEKYIDDYKVDGFIINSSLYSCFNGVTFDLLDINRLSKTIKEKNKLVLINVDRIIQENELNDLKEFINNLECYDYLIYSDISFLNFYNDYEKLIYDPKTLVASSYEKNVFDEMGIKSFVANELSYDELNKMSLNTNLNLMVYGYHQMMYSFRPLLTLYNEFMNGDKDLLNKLFYLKEELRDDKYLVYQSNHGTFVYTSYIYAAFKELVSLKESLGFVRFNSFNIDEEKMIRVIDLYKLLFVNENSDELYNKLCAIDSNISSGFLKQESVLLKGGSDE